MSDYNKKSNRFPREKVFIVTESYSGNKNLSDLFTDLVYSAYCKNGFGTTGKKLNHTGYPPKYRVGHTHYGNGVY